MLTTTASHMSAGICDVIMKLSGTANAMMNSVPKMITGRRPSLSESAPSSGIVMSCPAPAAVTPMRYVLRSRP
ncbi:hypothetical protein D3C83_177450 [compost metagenome]